MPLRKIDKDGKSHVYVALALVVPLALICLIPTGIGLWLVARYNDKTNHIATSTSHLSRENAERIREIQRLRKTATFNARAADLAACRSQNKTNLAVRKLIVTGPKRAKFLLISLGFTPKQIATYEQQATKLAREQSMEVPVIGVDSQHPKGDCSKLPNPNAKPKNKKH